MKISDSERAELIRKGNALFNAGKVKDASRIFETVKYGDGLIRTGNYYYKKKELLYALSFYQKASYDKGIKVITREIITVFRTWLKEGA
jgi:hypothetical protein